MKRLLSGLVVTVFVVSCFSSFLYATTTNDELQKYKQDKSDLNAKIIQARETYLGKMRDLRKDYSQKAQALEDGDKAGRTALSAQKKLDKEKIVNAYREEHESLMDQLRTLKDSTRKVRVEKAKSGDKQWNVQQVQ